MVPILDSMCSVCGRPCRGYELSASRCSDCFEKLKATPPAPREKIRQCSVCKVFKPLDDLMLFEDGWFCVDCNPRGVLGNECPICNVIKADSEMATDRKCCLDCAVELDRGVRLTQCTECGMRITASRDEAALCTVCATRVVELDREKGLTQCPECGKRVAAARDGAALCTECATRPRKQFGGPGAVEKGRVCLVCRLVLPLEMYDGQGTICKTCSSGLPSDLVKRMQRCRGCNLEKPSGELLGTMYCDDCRRLQEFQAAMKTMPGIEVPGSIAGAYTPTAKRSAGAPQIGRIPRAIATEEE